MRWGLRPRPTDISSCTIPFFLPGTPSKVWGMPLSSRDKAGALRAGGGTLMGGEHQDVCMREGAGESKRQGPLWQCGGPQSGVRWSLARFLCLGPSMFTSVPQDAGDAVSLLSPTLPPHLGSAPLAMGQGLGGCTEGKGRATLGAFRARVRTRGAGLRRPLAGAGRASHPHPPCFRRPPAPAPQRGPDALLSPGTLRREMFNPVSPPGSGYAERCCLRPPHGIAPGAPGPPGRLHRSSS